ncbi:MAG TPA: hypothetical protein VFD45_03620 [Patescibacteria group bacterium]|nr:hypothetical protein [Patescibacteria group bacterium]
MAIGKEVIRNGVNIIAPFRRDASKNGYGVEISPVRQNALERLLRTRVIDRSIGEGDIPFPIVPGNYLDGASENAIIDVLDVTVRHKLPIDSVRNPVFVIDDDLGSIMDNLSKHYQNGEKPSIAILVDRERGVVEELRKRGYDVHSVFTATRINKFCLDNGYMTPEECAEMQRVIERNRPFNGIGFA